jgi:CBS-domain-containing membrane protein
MEESDPSTPAMIVPVGAASVLVNVFLLKRLPATQPRRRLGAIGRPVRG